MDQIYAKLLDRIGYPLKEKLPGGSRELIQTISHLLFADDGILLANSVTGLWTQVNLLVKVFRECGMEINPAKCAILARRPVG